MSSHSISTVALLTALLPLHPPHSTPTTQLPFTVTTLPVSTPCTVTLLFYPALPTRVAHCSSPAFSRVQITLVGWVLHYVSSPAVCLRCSLPRGCSFRAVTVFFRSSLHATTTPTLAYAHRPRCFLSQRLHGTLQDVSRFLHHLSTPL